MLVARLALDLFHRRVGPNLVTPVVTSEVSVLAVTPVRRTPSSDIRALAILAIFLILTIWNRITFDGWIGADFDIPAFFLPWYAHLGAMLRAGDVPGWNPYVFAGAPFAADPESGWAYLPAMVCFALMSPFAAFKAMFAVQVVVATLSTYAFARVLGMGGAGALVAAAVYAGGPFLRWATDGETTMAQVAAWLPLSMLGVEMTMRAPTWRQRALGAWIGGIGVSQMLAAWLGQGAMYGLLAVASYAVYRVFTESPPRAGGRVLRLAAAAAAVGLGAALGAVGMLPRLATVAETTLSEGYEGIVGLGSTYAPFELPYLLFRLLALDAPRRAMALGGAPFVLALLAPMLARRRFAVPYFVMLTAVVLILMVPRTPLHDLFYLLPRFRDFHEHQPFRVVIVAPIALAILSGATVETLVAQRGQRRLLWGIGAVVFAVAAMAWFADAGDARFVGWPPIIAAIVALVLVTAVLAVRAHDPHGVVGTLHIWAPALLAVCVFAQPTGLELTGSWFGWPVNQILAPIWRSDGARDRALQAYASDDDPTGAGVFLQARRAAGEPFRYVGYGGLGYPGDRGRNTAYEYRVLAPHAGALLVNGRPFFLGLEEIQGYNPSQLRRYAEFVTTMNGKLMNYHHLYLLASGTRSPLLRLLNVRYVVLDAGLPPDREDVVALTTGWTEVYRTDLAVVYEDPAALPRAWIVHDVRQVAHGKTLPLLAGGQIDPRQTALVESEPPPALAPPNPTAESTTVVRWEPDALTIAVEATAPGLLVLSEIYASGWRATVDGQRTPILPTDHILRGIPIPAGSHVVELRFEPPAFRVGMVISVVSVVAMCATLAAVGIDWANTRRQFRKRSPLSPRQEIPETASLDRGIAPS
jgi:hypothetical protein